MDKLQAENEKRLLQHEKEAFKQLKSSYTNALADIKARVKILQSSIDDLQGVDTSGFDERQLEIYKSQIQSKVYQLEYQKTLGKQVGSIVDVLKQDTISNVQGYLDKMYTDSYLGIQYYINKKGIPITTPINPSEVVKVVNKKIEEMTYADRINTNMNDFKKTIKAEISRGLASGSSYKEIANNLSMVTGEEMYKSQRIVRTEGARVSSEAKLTSIRDMKEKGADLVKVWDSTLDGSTRPVHGLLDGKWAEVNEPFKVAGYKVMGPGMFGNPSQDCNCRCVLLSVPRWDIEDSVIKYDNEHDILIEVKNYEDWKKGYYRTITNEELKIPIKNLEIVREKIKIIENKIKDNTQEMLVAFDGEGNKILEKQGNKQEVVLNDKDREKLPNALVTHNHPTSQRFSDGDITTFVYTDMEELRVVTKDGKTYSIRKNNEKQDKEQFINDYMRITINNKEEFKKYFEQKIKLDKLDPNGKEAGSWDYYERVKREFNANWLKNNAQKYGYKYMEYK